MPDTKEVIPRRRFTKPENVGRLNAFLNHPDVMTNPQQAALDSGYAKRSATSNAYTMRRKYADQIAEISKKRFDRMGINASRIQEEMAYLGFANTSDFLEMREIEVNIPGTDQQPPHKEKRSVLALRDIGKMPSSLTRAIKEIEFDSVFDPASGQMIQCPTAIKLHDKRQSLLDLAKVMGLLNEKVMLLTLGGKKESGDQVEAMVSKMDTNDLEAIEKIHLKYAVTARKQIEHRKDDDALDGEFNEA